MIHLVVKIILDENKSTLHTRVDYLTRSMQLLSSARFVNLILSRSVSNFFLMGITRARWKEKIVASVIYTTIKKIFIR